MSRFIRGFVIGMILGQLVTPMRGQQMRRFLSERIQRLLGYLPDSAQVKHYAQQVVDRTSQGMSDVKNTAQQVTPKLRNAAQQLSNAAQENISKAKDTLISQKSKSQDDPLERMESVSPELREKLEHEGIQSTPELLENAQTQAERANLANQVGVTHRMLREFVYRADLMRLTHLGEDMANVLEEAGVNGCSDLQNRNPEHLHSKLLSMQENGEITTPVPDIEQITAWIAEAKDITRSRGVYHA